MALVLIGEGEAEFEGERYSMAAKRCGAPASPVELASQGRHQLINGTQAMLAVGCLELEAAETLANSADVVCALTLDAQRGTPRAFDPRIHQARPQAGQLASAARSGALLRGQRDSRIASRLRPRAGRLFAARAFRRFTARCSTRWPKRAAFSPSS
jgi:histidine ammonia-lyase